MFNPSWLSREALEAHSVDLRQFVDFRPATLPNGTRIVEAYNASGLHFTLLPDRGLDIWTAHYRGFPLTWIAPGSPFPPDAGQTWIQQFNGGLLSTCGLTHVGPPETDAESGAVRDLHGRYSRLRAEDVSVYRRGWTPDLGYVVELYGTISEQALFGEQLVLRRAVALTLDKPMLEVQDEVTNLSDHPIPHMILYHYNVGYPLVRGGVRLSTPHIDVLPRDAAAQAGYARWAEYDAPTPNYAEQVFFHHVRAGAGDSGTVMSQAVLAGDDFGIVIGFDTRTLPYLTQWKNTRRAMYVSGIEPGNCIPEGQNAARSSGRLQWLQPGETRTYYSFVRVLETADQVAAERALIERYRERGVPAAGVALDDYRALLP